MNSLRALALFAVLVVLDLSSVTAQPVSLYQSELAAVKAAADIYNPLSIRENREYMGTLYNVGDQFAYTVTAGVRGASSIALKIPRLATDTKANSRQRFSTSVWKMKRDIDQQFHFWKDSYLKHPLITPSLRK